jgi:predicted alpha/beta-hydrolase family hydrolase
MFVHGTRDGFGSIDEVIAALKLVQARTELLPITGEARTRDKRNRDEVPKIVLEAFRVFAYDVAG